MLKFYLHIWLRWALRVTLCSVIVAVVLSFSVTLYSYLKGEATFLTPQLYGALWSIFKFWLSIGWSFTLLFALIRSIKYIFNTPLEGYVFKLQECTRSSYIEYIGYGDLVKVWRKWFMLLIWLSVVMMLFSTLFLYIFSAEGDLYRWFSIEWMFGYILLSGYLSFILLPSRCKRVKVVKC
jgi:Ca2+/Na+ antiporter